MVGGLRPRAIPNCWHLRMMQQLRNTYKRKKLGKRPRVSFLNTQFCSAQKAQARKDCHKHSTVAKVEDCVLSWRGDRRTCFAKYVKVLDSALRTLICMDNLFIHASQFSPIQLCSDLSKAWQRSQVNRAIVVTGTRLDVASLYVLICAV